MIKLVTFQKRVPALTRPMFEDRWLTIHAPMAARFPGLRSYMLAYSIEPGEPPADGVAQLWFDSRPAAQESYASEIGRDGSRDASAYLARREHMLASEAWRLGRMPDGMRHKLLICAKRQQGQSRADFAAWWMGDGTAVVAGLAADAPARLSVDEAGLLLNSASSGQLGLIEGEGVHDGMLEQWFATETALHAAADRLEADPAWSALTAATERLERGLLFEHTIVPASSDIMRTA